MKIEPAYRGSGGAMGWIPAKPKSFNGWVDIVLVIEHLISMGSIKFTVDDVLWWSSDGKNKIMFEKKRSLIG